MDRQLIYARGPGQTIETREIVGDIEQPGASVTLRELNDYQLVEEAPKATWRWFFPAINPNEGDRYQYPKPYTEEFCRIYGERLSSFCKAAKLLTEAIRHLDRKLPAGTGLDLAREQALRAINWLRAPVGSVLDCDEAGSFQSRRVSSSLIASYADMYAQDLAYGLAQFQCASCGTPFFSSAYQSRYCQRTCRLKAQKRRLRAQMKKAGELRARGKSLHEIAAILGQPRPMIKGWLERR